MITMEKFRQEFCPKPMVKNQQNVRVSLHALLGLFEDVEQRTGTLIELFLMHFLLKDQQLRHHGVHDVISSLPLSFRLLSNLLQLQSFYLAGLFIFFISGFKSIDFMQKKLILLLQVGILAFKNHLYLLVVPLCSLRVFVFHIDGMTRGFMPGPCFTLLVALI